MFLLIPAALACPLTIHPDERGAFFGALAQEIPAEGALAADGHFRSWRETGKPEALRLAAEGYAEAAADPRAKLMAVVLGEALGEPSRWRESADLKDHPLGVYVTYELARRRGVCGGYAGFRRLSFPDEHPLALFEMMGEAYAGWGWGIATWDVTLEARRLALDRGRDALADELDALSVKMFADTSPDADLPDFLADRCGGDAGCESVQTAAIQAAR